MPQQAQCIIWGSPATYLGGYKDRDGSAFDSPRAGGKYFITRSIAHNVANMSDDMKVKISRRIVDANKSGNVLDISSYTIDEIKNDTRSTVSDRSSRLLQYLINISEHIGKKLSFPAEVKTENSGGMLSIGLKWGINTAPLFAHSDSLERDEVEFLIEILVSEGLVRTERGKLLDGLVVMPAGYARAEHDQRRIRSNQAFVAMWFDPTMDEPYGSGVEPAIRDCGYKPVRIDRIEHINKIDDEIIAEIRRSKFLVADFTSELDRPRGGVYFEAGFAMGLGIPVIWMCRSDQMASVHFDTRQFNHIVWLDGVDLRTKLSNRISAVII